MLEYCEQDVLLNEKVYYVLEKEGVGFSQDSVDLETQVAQIMHQQEHIVNKKLVALNTAELMSQTTSTSTPPATTRTGAEATSSGKKKLTTLFAEWRQRFGHDPCIFWWNKKVLNS